MRFANVLAASASLLSLAHARISGIGIPSIIRPGDNFDLVIEGRNYIQSITDVSIAVGWNYGCEPYGNHSLGSFLTAFNLVADSNHLGNYIKPLSLPTNARLGEATFNAGLLSLLGAVSLPVYYPFNISFIIGPETSTQYTFVSLNGPVSL